jgi:hypothetical protein
VRESGHLATAGWKLHPDMKNPLDGQKALFHANDPKDKRTKSKLN